MTYLELREFLPGWGKTNNIRFVGVEGLNYCLKLRKSLCLSGDTQVLCKHQHPFAHHPALGSILCWNGWTKADQIFCERLSCNPARGTGNGLSARCFFGTRVVAVSKATTGAPPSSMPCIAWWNMRSWQKAEGGNMLPTGSLDWEVLGQLGWPFSRSVALTVWYVLQRLVHFTNKRLSMWIPGLFSSCNDYAFMNAANNYLSLLLYASTAANGRPDVP